MALNLSIRIPGQPDTILLAQLVVLGFSSLHLLMRKLNYKLVWTELELWVIILSLTVFQVYFRNPVGINIFGGDTVGGKGYALFGIAVLTCILLSGLKVPEKQLRWMLPISIIGSLGNLGISIIGALVPAIGYYTGATYARTDEVNYENFGTVVDEGAATRVGFAGVFARSFSLYIASYRSPLLACFKPVSFFLVILVIGAALISGYRNAIVGVGLTFVIGIAYRSGTRGLLLSSLGAMAIIVLLALVNIINPLPPNIQRSLTFLPGTWEERYKLDAKGSTEWRVEIWKEALTSEKWIRNKIFGDGLGFRAEDLQKSYTLKKGSGGFDLHREQVLISGDYHSGPVSTIRVVGYVGLILFLVAQIRLAIHGHRQIVRCRNTEWYPLALFIGIPLIYGPIFFAFIFGDFKGSVSAFMLSLGMVRLLQNNLPLPPWKPIKFKPYMINSMQAMRN